jgi:translation elongation factor EF-Tu-like GTPase
MHGIIRVSLLLTAALCGCRGEMPAKNQPTFRFTVEDVFYIKPLDRVILVGTVHEGTVRPGDTATVECKTGPVSVIVEGIEAFQQGEIPQASKGEQVGLKLQGITKDQPSRGDRVIGMGGG